MDIEFRFKKPKLPKACKPCLCCSAEVVETSPNIYHDEDDSLVNILEISDFGPPPAPRELISESDVSTPSESAVIKNLVRSEINAKKSKRKLLKSKEEADKIAAYDRRFNAFEEDSTVSTPDVEKPTTLPEIKERKPKRKVKKKIIAEKNVSDEENRTSEVPGLSKPDEQHPTCLPDINERKTKRKVRKKKIESGTAVIDELTSPPVDKLTVLPEKKEKKKRRKLEKNTKKDELHLTVEEPLQSSAERPMLLRINEKQLKQKEKRRKSKDVLNTDPTEQHQSETVVDRYFRAVSELSPEQTTKRSKKKVVSDRDVQKQKDSTEVKQAKKTNAESMPPVMAFQSSHSTEIKERKKKTVAPSNELDVKQAKKTNAESLPPVMAFQSAHSTENKERKKKTVAPSYDLDDLDQLEKELFGDVNSPAVTMPTMQESKRVKRKTKVDKKDISVVDGPVLKRDESCPSLQKQKSVQKEQSKDVEDDELQDAIELILKTTPPSFGARRQMDIGHTSIKKEEPGRPLQEEDKVKTTPPSFGARRQMDIGHTSIKEEESGRPIQEDDKEKEDDVQLLEPKAKKSVSFNMERSAWSYPPEFSEDSLKDQTQEREHIEEICKAACVPERNGDGSDQSTDCDSDWSLDAKIQIKSDENKTGALTKRAGHESPFSHQPTNTGISSLSKDRPIQSEEVITTKTVKGSGQRAGHESPLSHQPINTGISSLSKDRPIKSEKVITTKTVKGSGQRAGHESPLSHQPINTGISSLSKDRPIKSEELITTKTVKGSGQRAGHESPLSHKPINTGISSLSKDRPITSEEVITTKTVMGSGQRAGHESLLSHQPMNTGISSLSKNKPIKSEEVINKTVKGSGYSLEKKRPEFLRLPMPSKNDMLAPNPFPRQGALPPVRGKMQGCSVPIHKVKGVTPRTPMALQAPMKKQPLPPSPKTVRAYRLHCPEP